MTFTNKWWGKICSFATTNPEPESPRWEVNNDPTEAWHGLSITDTNLKFWALKLMVYMVTTECYSINYIRRLQQALREVLLRNTKDQAVCMFHEGECREGMLRNRRAAPRILEHASRLCCAVNYNVLPLYTRTRNIRYRLNRPNFSDK
jgi:hypothetical protein